MEYREVLTYKYSKGRKTIFPSHDYVKNWMFEENQEEEAMLANALAVVAEKHQLTKSELMNLYPAILRMMKCTNIKWSL